MSDGRHPRFFPVPREVHLGSTRHTVDPAAPSLRHDAALGPEAYAIEVSSEGIDVRYGDERALRYARQTLESLRRAYGDSWPESSIRDRPDFPVRGYMLDVSRDRVPTRATLERIVGLLARLRINHLQLYTEHTFAYRDHRDVWRDASPITPEDVAWLDALCRESGIELAANQNAFGHMERWLARDAYRSLAETPDGWETRWGRTQPASVLAPSDESLAFVASLFDELLPCFSSRRVNVNCDETFELGHGWSRAEVERRGRGRVYVDFLLRILELVHRQGKEALFWGDIVRQSPELLPLLPANDTVALVWHYEGPMEVERLPPELFEILGDFGVTPETLRGFSGHVRPFADSGRPFWVCPGTSSWNSLVGRLPNARANLRDAAEQGLAAGAGGYLITDWGDSGHLQPPSVSFPPLAYGAAVSWCLQANREVETAGFLSDEIFEDPTGRLADALEAAGGLSRETGVQPFNGSVLHYQLLGGGLSFLARLMGEPTQDGLARVVASAGEILDSISAARPQCADGALVQREIAQAVGLARHGAWRSARQGGFDAPTVDVLRADLAAAIEEQRACWLERSRPGGLADSLARLEGTLAEYTS